MTVFSAGAPLATGPVVLEASAGTGKTWSIGALYVRLVAERGLTVDQILVVTYTRAATAELRDRLRRRLRDALHGLRDGRADPVSDLLRAVPHAAGRLEQALADFDEACIHTIHGFCQHILRRHAVACDADLRAPVEGDARPLIAELAADFWAANVDSMDPALYAYCRKQLNADTLTALGVRWYRDPSVQVETESDGGVVDHGPMRAAFDTLRDQWRARTEDLDALHAWRHCLRKDAALTLEWRTEVVGDWLDAGYEPATCWARGEELAHFTPRGIAADTLAKYVADAPVDLPLWDSVAAYRAAYDELQRPLAACVVALELAFLEFLSARAGARARGRARTAYDDLLRTLRDALCDPAHGPALATRLRQQYGAALVDEFQDTDAVQWDIFHRLFVADGDGAPMPTLYLVGDPKQAIYQFRGADVFAYLRAADELGQPQRLGTNHRSDARLVDGLNYVFGQWDDAFLHPGIVADTVQAAPRPTRWVTADREARVRLLFLNRPGRPAYLGAATKTVAQTAADDIVRLLGAHHRLRHGDSERPVGPGDCAVLVRSNWQAAAVEEALDQLCVPSVSSIDGSVLQSAEAGALLFLLEAIVSRQATGALRVALTGPLRELDACELVALEADDERWEALRADVERWRQLWIDEGFAPALRRALAELGSVARLLARPGGAQAATNLGHLVEELHAVSRRERLRPGALLAWYRRLLRDPPPDDVDDEWSLRRATDADAVQIVTMHRAKGLEYPFVWCPFLWWTRNPSDLDRAHLQVHDEAPPHTARLHLRSTNSGPGSPFAAHLREEEAEARRLLYVALTRARHLVTVPWLAVQRMEGAALSARLHPLGADGKGGPALRTDLDRFATASGGCVTVETPPDVGPAPWNSGPPQPLSAEIYDRARLDTWWRRASYTSLTQGVHLEPHEEDGLDHDDDAPTGLAAHERDTEDPWDAASGAHLAGSDESDRDADAGGRALEVRDGERDSATSAVAESALDNALASTPAAVSTEPAGTIPLVDFPRGSVAGSCLHAVLEHADFTAGLEGLRPLVQRALTAFDVADQGWTDRVTAALAAALATPLTPSPSPGKDHGLRLDRVPPEDTLRELSFEFAVAPAGGQVPQRALAQTLGRWAGPGQTAYAQRVGRLKFRPLRGYLTGFIDLVFRYEGRYYLADWKATWLGPNVSDYRIEALRTAMDAHHYTLQSLLYTVALHRFLALRVPDYDCDRHLGGAFYLFLRGMVGGGTGVFHTRPPSGLILELSALFEQGAR